MAIAPPILGATIWPRGIYDPVTGHDATISHPAPPSLRHPLGTDNLGHDLLSMILAGAKPALILGIVAALTTAVIGTTIGACSAYYGGRLDIGLSRLSDIFLLMPPAIFMIAAGSILVDAGPVTLGLIFGLIAGAGNASIVLRSQALVVMSKPFIEAARVAGGGARHIILKHVVPYLIPHASLFMMVTISTAIITDAFASYVGYTKLYLTWGTMVYVSFVYSQKIFGIIEWHVLIASALAISTFSAAFYFVSRGLQDIVSPRIRTE